MYTQAPFLHRHAGGPLGTEANAGRVCLTSRLMGQDQLCQGEPGYAGTPVKFPLAVEGPVASVWSRPSKPLSPSSLLLQAVYLTVVAPSEGSSPGDRSWDPWDPAHPHPRLLSTWGALLPSSTWLLSDCHVSLSSWLAPVSFPALPTSLQGGPRAWHTGGPSRCKRQSQVPPRTGAGRGRWGRAGSADGLWAQAPADCTSLILCQIYNLRVVCWDLSKRRDLGFV